MSYTATQIKSYTSVPGVSAWSDDKILLYQSMAESTLASLNLDTSMSGYATAYNNAIVLLFDWFAENPTGTLSNSVGKVSASYPDSLPANVRQMLSGFIRGANSGLQGASMLRKDIGLR